MEGKRIAGESLKTMLFTMVTPEQMFYKKATDQQDQAKFYRITALATFLFIYSPAIPETNYH